MTWVNAELAERFDEIAALLELTDADRHRVRAYERAAEAVRAASADLSELPRAELTAVPGVGRSTADKIAQHLDTGRIDLLEELRARVPEGVRELTRVPGLGPKTAMRLHDELGVDSVEDLRSALDAGRVRELSGLGTKSEERLRAGLDRLGAKDQQRLPVAEAHAVAEALCAALAGRDDVVEVVAAGSLRRLRATVGDVDVLAASEADAAPIHAAFRDLDLVAEVLVAGERKTSVLTRRHLQADLRVVSPQAWGAALVYFTGSKAHNIRIRERAVRRGLTLNEYGLARSDDASLVASRTEADVYAALDLAWIPPTLREDTGEVEAADTTDGRAPTLPRLVEPADLQGDLHGHSDWSGDGKASLPAMLAAAHEGGLSYWAVTDHAVGLPMNGIDAEGFARRREAIAAARETTALAVLDGVELNILGEGALDFDGDVLARFDWCVAAIHTQLEQDAATQTERILQAIANPFVNAIGHPTGRRLGQRPGYDLELEAILQACAETGTALELNGSPSRLDLPTDLARRAVDAGVWLTISTDAHATHELANLAWGARYAQRAWVTPEQVLSCQPVERVRQVVAEKRERLA